MVKGFYLLMGLCVGIVLYFSFSVSAYDEEAILELAFESKINMTRFKYNPENAPSRDRMADRIFDNKLLMVFPVVCENSSISLDWYEASEFGQDRSAWTDRVSKSVYHLGSDISHRSTSDIGIVDYIKIVSATDGEIYTLRRSNTGKGFGVYVAIKEPTTGILFYYGHMKEGSIPDALKEGTQVVAGQVLGIMGNTGYVKGDTGIHLHFGASVPGIVEFIEEGDTKEGYIDPYHEKYFVYDGSTIPDTFETIKRFPSEY